MYENLKPPFENDIPLVAVYVVNSEEVSLTGCEVSNADYGIYAHTMDDITVSGGTFEDITEAAMYLTEGGSGDIDIIGNNILRTPFGILCYDNPDAEIKIEGNTIDYTGIANPTDTMTAIFVVELTPGDLSNPNKVSMTENEIVRAPCGIHTMNLFSSFPSGGTGPLYIGNNKVSVFQPSYTGTAHSGILTENNTLALIVDNEVYRQGNDVNWWETAIRVSGGMANQVVCNHTHDIGKGLFFDNDQRPLTHLILNDMENHDGGIFLNYSIIGDQGGTDNPFDNRWLGTWTGTNYGTHCYGSGSVGSDSPFYVRNSSPYLPPNNHDSNGAPSQVTVNTTGGSWTNGCMYSAPSFKTEGEPEGLADAMAIVSQSEGTEMDSDIRRGMRWAGEYGLYKAMLMDEELRYADNALSSFFTERDNGSMGQLHRALAGFRAARSGQGMTVSQAGVTSIQPGSLPEQRLKDVLGILYANITDLKGIGDGQGAQLRDIAQLCPIDNGFGVYMARAALLKLDTVPRMYTSECEQVPSPAQYENWKVEGVNSDEETGFAVYPNPNNGSMTVRYHLSEGESGTLTVYSVLGERIHVQPLKGGADQMELNLSSVNSGIYLLNLEVNGGRRLAERLIIMRE